MAGQRYSMADWPSGGLFYWMIRLMMIRLAIRL
jgi:hypothetical protein